VTQANVGRVAGLGADIVVSGSAIFDGNDVAANAAYMLKAVDTAVVPRTSTR
jgi:pentose-5-phosphate-3-epimerase